MASSASAAAPQPPPPAPAGAAPRRGAGSAGPRGGPFGIHVEKQRAAINEDPGDPGFDHGFLRGFCHTFYMDFDVFF